MVTRDELAAFIRETFPNLPVTIDASGDETTIVRHAVTRDDLRPGDTVAGPVLMTVADVALYVAILSRIGMVALAVTTSLNVNFLRKPRPDREIVGVCKLLKVGRSLAVGEVTLYSAGEDEPVAHAVGTYAIPPDSPAQR